MGEDGKHAIFHDFLGTTCGNWPEKFSGEAATVMEAEASASAWTAVSSGGHSLISGSYDPVTERWVASKSNVCLSQERGNDSSGREARNTSSGKKRNYSDSAYMGFKEDKMTAMLGKAAVNVESGKYQKDEVQTLPRPILSHSPVSNRHVLLAPKWERPMHMDPGSMVHYPSCLAQSGSISSSNASKNTNVGTVLMSQPAADEGSMTGIKGSGVVKVVASSSGALDRSMAGFLSSRSKAPLITEPESSNTSRYHGMHNVSRQMTIFYAGQAHVFDDVHPNKAEVILSLAGSTGGSWSTSNFRKPAMCPSLSEVKVLSGENRKQISTLPSLTRGNPEHELSQAGRPTLTKDIQSATSGGQHSGKVS